MQKYKMKSSANEVKNIRQYGTLDVSDEGLKEFHERHAKEVISSAGPDWEDCKRMLMPKGFSYFWHDAVNNHGIRAGFKALVKYRHTQNFVKAYYAMNGVDGISNELKKMSRYTHLINAMTATLMPVDGDDSRFYSGDIDASRKRFDNLDHVVENPKKGSPVIAWSDGAYRKQYDDLMKRCPPEFRDQLAKLIVPDQYAESYKSMMKSSEEAKKPEKKSDVKTEPQDDFDNDIAETEREKQFRRVKEFDSRKQSLLLERKAYVDRMNLEMEAASGDLTAMKDAAIAKIMADYDQRMASIKDDTDKQLSEYDVRFDENVRNLVSEYDDVVGLAVDSDGNVGTSTEKLLNNIKGTLKDNAKTKNESDKTTAKKPTRKRSVSKKSTAEKSTVDKTVDTESSSKASTKTRKTYTKNTAQTRAELAESTLSDVAPVVNASVKKKSNAKSGVGINNNLEKDGGNEGPC